MGGGGGGRGGLAPPFAGASFARASQDSLPRATKWQLKCMRQVLYSSDSRFTIHDSRFTIHFSDSRFTIHDFHVNA